MVQFVRGKNVHFKHLLTMTMAVAFGFSSPTVAQEETSFDLELNSAKDTEAGNCRLTYVAANQTGSDLERAAYEVAVFDAEGTVTRLLALDFGGLVDGKTKILLFELGATTCASISRIIVNDSAACTVGGAESPVCMQVLNASSRVAIQFGI